MKAVSPIVRRRRFTATSVTAPGLSPNPYLSGQTGSLKEEGTLGVFGCGSRENGNVAPVPGQGRKVVIDCAPDFLSLEVPPRQIPARRPLPS